jgi:hypothetical protein
MLKGAGLVVNRKKGDNGLRIDGCDAIRRTNFADLPGWRSATKEGGDILT